MFPSTFLSILTGQSAEICVFAAGAASCRAAFGAACLLPLLGDWSFGGRESLATKHTEVHKESAQHAPSVV